MFNKILIANRGEIACRVIQTAKRLGVRTVAVYSDADRTALHTKMADEAIHIGLPPSQESYLIGQKIIDAAIKTGAQAIHPGYGFLSENADFAQLCADKQIVFIGPPVEAIKAMGSKSAAKTIMENADVPLVPGYHGADQNPDLLKQAADDMGYPVLLKAVAGGGGKGMRQVHAADEFEQALGDAKREALASFNNDDMLVEKYLTQPRHVEVQVFCDQHSNGVYLFERDCSVQRRHQKVIEEAPAPHMSNQLRHQMGETALRAAQAINHQGAGTVEFLLNTDNSFYFMEMNTRLQVEHPVTEMITRQDLVEWQLRVANGEPLPLQQSELSIRGHAFEARIYAEDPNNDFLPATGKLTHLQTPLESQHVRVDTGVQQGDEISPYYDPMIAKLIVWDENRTSALARLTQALSEYQISGVTTNTLFLYNLASCPAFIQAELDTGFIEKHRNTIFHQSRPDILTNLPIAGFYLLLHREKTLADLNNSNDKGSPWATLSSWRLNQSNIHTDTIVIDDQSYNISAKEVLNEQSRQFRITIKSPENSTEQHFVVSGELNGNHLDVTIDGHRQQILIVPHAQHFTLFTQTGALEFSLAKVLEEETDNQSSTGNFKAPMNGTIAEALVKSGDRVSKGDVLIIMEAMKMQHPILAPSDGTVTELFFTQGELVDGGATLLNFESDN